MLKKLFFICCVAVLLTACPEPLPEDDAYLRIVNNSEEDVFWFFSFERFGEWNEMTSVDVDSWLKKQETYIILRRNTHIRGFNSSATKENLRRGWIKYYLFNYDSVKTIPWERIREERIILKEVRFDTWEDFERCNFEITYP